MKLTVAKLLKLQAYKEAVLVAGFDGLSNEVTGITIMEDITISEWLRGGEALLTSLIPVKNYSGLEIISFFNTLLKNKISVIIIKTGKNIDKIPEELLKWANENDIPVIQVPRHLFYTDLMYPVMAEIMESQVNRLSYFKLIHEKFREMAIKDYPLKVVLTTLSEIIGNPVEIYDKNYNLMISTFKETQDVKSEPELIVHKDGQGQLFTEKFLDKPDVNVKGVIFEISALGNTKSYLSVLEQNKPVDEMDLLAVENACTNIALIMARKIAIKEVEERFMNNIVDDLINGVEILNDSLLERANIAGIDLFCSYTIIVLKLHCSLDLIKYSLKKQLGYFVTKYKGIYSLKTDHVIIFVNTKEVEKLEKKRNVSLKDEVGRIADHITGQESSHCFSAGIGNEAKNFEGIRKSYEQAINALTIGEEIDKEGFIQTYDELGIYKIISDISNQGDISKYIPQSILKIIKADEAKNSLLLDTLRVYLKNNQHIKLTANELFIHPKTVSYRLEQIKEIGGIDLKNTEELLEIQFALKILMFQEKQLKFGR